MIKITFCPNENPSLIEYDWLSRGEVTLLTGEAAVGKIWLALRVGLREVSCECLLHPGWPNRTLYSKPSRHVLFFTNVEDRLNINQRIPKIVSSPRNISLSSLSSKPMGLLWENGKPTEAGISLEKEASLEGTNLLVIHTADVLHDKGYNGDTDGVKAFMSFWRECAQRNNLAVLVVRRLLDDRFFNLDPGCHSRQKDENWMWSADAIWVLEHTEKAPSGHAIHRLIKINKHFEYFKPGRRFCLDEVFFEREERNGPLIPIKAE